MTIAMLFLVLMVSFHKADFLNLTVCCVAIYTLVLADVKDQQHDKIKWRLIIYGATLSLVYDITWFILRQSDLNADVDSEGGVEISIKKFSLYLAYFTFFFKFIMLFVYWKVSVNFADFYDERNEF